MERKYPKAKKENFVNEKMPKGKSERIDARMYEIKGQLKATLVEIVGMYICAYIDLQEHILLLISRKLFSTFFKPTYSQHSNEIFA